MAARGGRAGIYYPAVGSRLAPPDYSVQGSQSARAQLLIAQRFPALGAEQGVVVFYSAGLAAATPAYQQAVRRVLAVIPPGAGRLVGPYSAPGQVAGHVAVATLVMGESQSARAALAADLQRRIAGAARTGPVQAFFTGPSALTNDLSDVESVTRASPRASASRSRCWPCCWRSAPPWPRYCRW